MGSKRTLTINATSTHFLSQDLVGVVPTAVGRL